MASKVRLYVDHPLQEEQSVLLSREQAHYLFGVMRMSVGTVLSLINGKDGEWDAEVVEAGKRAGVLVCRVQTKPMQMPPDLWLLFSPIRKERMSFIVEKATELGAARMFAVHTAYTNNGDRVRLEKLQAQAVEATEQSGGTFVPEVTGPLKLKQVVANWDPTRTLYFCDEAMIGKPSGFADRTAGPAAILIGPEGGFTDYEVDKFKGIGFEAVHCGERILRVETAVVSLLSQHASFLK